ncbi:hypothetical protein [Xanthomonas medicagonis]|uniref:hypothetical protein n=1 Tax=Xanthomonas medicagonis TaxID=3160841 RepID=UPI003515C63F
MSSPQDIRDPYAQGRDVQRRSHAHRGSPWAWVALIVLVLAAAGWWLSRDDGGEAPSPDAPTNAAPATPASDPPRTP